jgi:hypothetical protein
MATEIKWRRPGKWLTLIPNAQTVGERVAELAEEMRQLGVLLKTAAELEKEQTSTKATNADEANN